MFSITHPQGLGPETSACSQPTLEERRTLWELIYTQAGTLAFAKVLYELDLSNYTPSTCIPHNDEKDYQIIQSLTFPFNVLYEWLKRGHILANSQGEDEFGRNIPTSMIMTELKSWEETLGFPRSRQHLAKMMKNLPCVTQTKHVLRYSTWAHDHDDDSSNIMQGHFERLLAQVDDENRFEEESEKEKKQAVKGRKRYGPFAQMRDPVAEPSSNMRRIVDEVLYEENGAKSSKREQMVVVGNGSKEATRQWWNDQWYSICRWSSGSSHVDNPSLCALLCLRWSVLACCSTSCGSTAFSRTSRSSRTVSLWSCSSFC